ncbi:MAG: hypothetical protein R3C61_21295 [Bacteroidia bacterium]
MGLSFWRRTACKIYRVYYFSGYGAYFNLYYLIPKFLSRGKFGVYILLLLLTIFACSALIASGYYLNAYLSDKTFAQLFGREPSDFMFFFSRAALPSTSASMTLAMSVKLAKNWIHTEREKSPFKRKILNQN